MRILIWMIAAMSLAACSKEYPDVGYFVEFTNSQESLSNGLLTFRTAEEWDSWQANEQERIELLAVRSTDARCSGQLRRTAENFQTISYELRTDPNGNAHEVLFGTNEVRCRTSAKIAEFRVSPIIPRQSLLDSEEQAVAQVEFLIQFEPVIQ